MTITDLDLGDNGAQTLSNNIRDMIISYNGKVLDSKFWGKRKFAYEINHKQEGFYDIIEFELAPSKVGEFKSKLNYVDGLVRYLVSTV